MSLVTLHLLILVCTVLTIVYADYTAFRYMRGHKPTLSKKYVRGMHHLVWLGLMGMIITGILLVLPDWDFWTQNLMWYLKMSFVLLLVINAFAIGALSRHAITTPYSDLLPRDRKRMHISGALSLTGWVAAALIVFFFLY